MTENAEPAAGPDIVEWLREREAAERAGHWLQTAGRFGDAATAIECLRKANALHVADEATIKQLRADIVRLNAELDAARGKEGQ